MLVKRLTSRFSRTKWMDLVVSKVGRTRSTRPSSCSKNTKGKKKGGWREEGSQRRWEETQRELKKSLKKAQLHCAAALRAHVSCRGDQAEACTRPAGTSTPKGLPGRTLHRPCKLPTLWRVLRGCALYIHSLWSKKIIYF